MLRRGMMVQLKHVANNQFDVLNMNGDLQLRSKEDYFIYMRDVKFIDDTIVGVYLGTASDAIIDDYCLDVELFNGDFYVELDKIQKARMVAVDSTNKKVIKIQ